MPSESHQVRQSAQNPYAADVYSDDQVEPVPAIPQGYAPGPAHVVPGVVFPYRGMQQHGVSPDAMPEELEEDIAGGKVIVNENYLAPTPDAPPVPVRIVDEGAHEYKQWRSYQTIASRNPTQIVNRKEGRTSLTVKNLDASDPVWVGPDSQVSNFSGFRLDAGGTFTLDGEAEVWAISGAADFSDVGLSVYFEFATPYQG